jgi:AraC family transcriptional regulator
MSRNILRGTSVADAYSEGYPAPDATPPEMWVQRVLTLLEEAMGELRCDADPALSALGEAASVLRARIRPAAEAASMDSRGRLLAWQARRVLAYIDAHIAETVLIADLCALVQRSEAHFSRSFKRTFGESPHAFLIRRRLQRAERYMLETEASLTDIALRCGFTDQAHLCKHFRHLTGSTPGSWRRARRTSAAVSSVEFQLRAGAPLEGNPAARS